MKTTDLSEKAICDLVYHAVDKLNDGVGDGSYGCDLHNELYNTDYFIIGYYQASEWLKSCDLDTFEVIETVIDYEKSNFGEVNTDINSEAIVNMFAYIHGEQILAESKTLTQNWDNKLTENQCKKIAKELLSAFNLD